MSFVWISSPQIYSWKVSTKIIVKQSQHLHSPTKKQQLWRHFCNLISDGTTPHWLFSWRLNPLPPFHITSAACSRNTHSLQVLSRLLATSAFYNLNMLSRSGSQKCPLNSQRSCGSISCWSAITQQRGIIWRAQLLFCISSELDRREWLEKWGKISRMWSNIQDVSQMVVHFWPQG